MPLDSWNSNSQLACAHLAVRQGEVKTCYNTVNFRPTCRYHIVNNFNIKICSSMNESYVVMNSTLQKPWQCMFQKYTYCKYLETSKYIHINNKFLKQNSVI